MSTKKQEGAFFFIAGLIAAIASAVYLLPCLVSPSTTVPSTYPDVYMFIWNIWISQHQTGLLPTYSTDLIFVPSGASLLLHTWCEGLTWPIARLFPSSSPIALFTSIVFGGLVVNVVAGVHLARTFALSRGASILVGLTLGFHPFVIGHLQGGHLNFVFVAPLFLALAIWLAPATTYVSKTQTLALAGVLVWTIYYNLYFTYYLALLTLILLMFEVVGGQRHWLRVTSLFVVPWVISGIVSGVHLYDVFELARSATYTPNHDPSKHSADLLNYLLPTANQLVGSVKWFAEIRALSQVNSAEQGVYVGWTLLFCAIGTVGLEALRPYRKWMVTVLLTAAVFLVLSAGPALFVFGSSLIELPWFTVIFNLLPAFPSVPIRFGFIAAILVAVVALRMLGSRSSKVQYVAALLLAFEFFPRPLATLVLEPTPVLRQVRESGVGNLLDGDEINEAGLIRQVFHERPIVGGYLARRPRSYERFVRRNKFLRFLRAGEVAPADSLRKSFDELRVTQVLVRADDIDKLARIRKVEWLEEKQSDHAVVLFQLRS